MDPEKPLVPSVAMTLANSAPGIFIEELADHRLGDGMDNGWVCRGAVQTRAVCFKIATWSDGRNLGPVSENAMIGRH
jgi:hypothetical protein